MASRQRSNTLLGGMDSPPTQTVRPRGAHSSVVAEQRSNAVSSSKASHN